MKIKEKKKFNGQELVNPLNRIHYTYKHKICENRTMKYLETREKQNNSKRWSTPLGF